MKTLRIISTLILLQCSFLIISAQEDIEWQIWINDVGKSRWFTYHLEKDDVLKMKNRWDEIGETIQKTENEFAGTYYQHDYMSGYFLRWSPERGYIFVRYFDVEHPCYFSFGTVSVTEAEINFNIEYESQNPVCPGEESTPKIWIPANGGKFLVPKTKLKDFADFYGGFNEYNGFYRKFNLGGIPHAFKWQKDFQAKDSFILPKGFEEFVKKSIEAEIISVGKTQTKKLKDFFLFGKEVLITPVEINAGSIQGAKKGTEFVLLNPDDENYQTLIITKAGKTKSKGNVVRRIDEDGKAIFPKYDSDKGDFIDTPFSEIKVGLKVTTSPVSKL